MSFGVNSIFGRVRASINAAQEQFEKAVKESTKKSLDPVKSATGQTHHTMRKGDTLDYVAGKSHQSIANILKVNPSIKSPNNIDVGVKIIILDPVRTSAYEEQRKALASIDKIPKGIAMQDTHEDAWNGVQQKVEQELRYVTRDGGAPQIELEAAAAEIKRRVPDDTKFASVVELAKNSVGDQLEAVGRTPENFDEILSLTETARTDQSKANALAKSVANGDAGLEAKAKLAEAKAEKSWSAVTDQTVPQLERLGKGNSKAERETEVTTRILTLATFGPDDVNYRKALDTAAKKELVDKPSKAIEDAYKDGGAPAAAYEARKQTKGVSAALASRILDASDATMVKVIKDLGTESREKLPAGSTSNPADLTKGDKAFLDHSRRDSNMVSDNTFVVVLGDLSAAYDMAAGTDIGDKATKRIALALAKVLPDANDMKYAVGERPIHNIEEAFEWVIAEKNGAVLTLETANQLREIGRTEYSEGLTGYVAEASKGLRKTALNDVAAFGAAREPFAALEDGPGKLIDPAKQRDAMAAAREGNPEAAKKFDTALENVRESGRALWKIQAAVSAYEPALADQKSFQDLKKTLSKSEDDKAQQDSLGFALEMGSDALVDIAANDPRIERRDLPGVTPWWPLRAGLDLTHDIAGRTINRTYDATHNTTKPGETGGGAPTTNNGPKPVTGYNSTTRFGLSYRFASTVLGGYHVDAMFQSKDFWGTAYGLAFMTTTARHGAEFLGGVAQSAVALSPRLQGGRIDKLSDFVKVERDLWTKSTGVYLKGWFGLDAAYTASNLSDGKYPEAAIFGVQTVADGMLAFMTKPKWVSPVGLGISFAAAAANFTYGKWKAENTREAFTEDYLKAADIRPEIAELIAAKKDMPSRIDAFAREWCRADGPAVVDYLNTLEPSKVRSFLGKLETVQKSGADDNGFLLTANNDYRFNPGAEQEKPGAKPKIWSDSDPDKPSWIPPRANGTPGEIGHVYPTSLRAVGLWAFGNDFNFPGRYERPANQPQG